MANKYTRISSTLKHCLYNEEAIKTKEKIKIGISDSISIDTITDEAITLVVKRNININEESNQFVTVSFEVVIGTQKIQTIEEIKEDIKSGMQILSSVYSRISLLLAQITQMSPIGSMITPPFYDAKSIIVL